MTTTTATKTPRSLVAAGTTNAAAGTTRAVLDLRTTFGGILTVRMTNGGTGPSVQCLCNVLVAHNSGSTPAAASKGTDWKTIASVGNGITASTDNEWSFIIDQSVMHLEVEFAGNTVQPVTVEAQFSELTNIVNA